MSLKWEKEGSENQNFVLHGHDGNNALLVYKVFSREDKKLNKATRKFEMITTPEHWNIIFSTIQIRKFNGFKSEKEALDVAEDIFLKAIEKIKSIVKYGEENWFLEEELNEHGIERKGE